jgi:hypothetical protein
MTIRPLDSSIRGGDLIVSHDHVVHLVVQYLLHIYQSILGDIRNLTIETFLDYWTGTVYEIVEFLKSIQINPKDLK